MLYVCAEYVNFPTTIPTRNYDLGSIDNPTGTAVNVVQICEHAGAEEWYGRRDRNAAIFPLRTLSKSMQSRARRAYARVLEFHPETTTGGEER